MIADFIFFYFYVQEVGQVDDATRRRGNSTRMVAIVDVDGCARAGRARS